MGKLLNGIKITKDDKNFQKIEKKYISGTLTLEEFNKLSNDKKTEYLQKELYKEHNYDKKINCEECAKKVIFDISGYISDEELSKLSLRK